MDKTKNDLIDDGKILGIDRDDFEKIVVSLCLLATTIVVLYIYLTTMVIQTDMIYLIGLFLTAFITRKGLSYWKPERYNTQRLEEKEMNYQKIENADIEVKKEKNLEDSVYQTNEVDRSPI